MQVRGVAIIALVLAAVVATPVYGATLTVEGRFGTVTYDGEEASPADSVASIVPVE